MKKLYFFLTAILLLAGCDKEKLPKEVMESIITIHSIDNTNMRTKLLVPIVVDGEELLVSRIPLLSNHDIMFCDIFQYREDQYGLEFQLTDKGRISWQQAAIEYRGMTGVLAQGGKFKCFMRFSREVGDSKVKIAAPLSKEEAETISKDIARNYIAIKEKS
jgi:hypothetical protein